MLTASTAAQPRCVFSSKFPNRKLGGRRVRVYNELVVYLRSKHGRMRTAMPPFVTTEFARKARLYMLAEDFA